MHHTFHLIANAHLDPVRLWDWREGLTEGIVTCRTILDLMDEDGELTFTRGEAAIYQHIERHDPATFRRIARYVKQGRWDVVGGGHIACWRIEHAKTGWKATATPVWEKEGK